MGKGQNPYTTENIILLVSMIQSPAVMAMLTTKSGLEPVLCFLRLLSTNTTRTGYALPILGTQQLFVLSKWTFGKAEPRVEPSREERNKNKTAIEDLKQFFKQCLRPFRRAWVSTDHAGHRVIEEWRDLMAWYKDLIDRSQHPPTFSREPEQSSMLLPPSAVTAIPENPPIVNLESKPPSSHSDCRFQLPAPPTDDARAFQHRHAFHVASALTIHAFEFETINPLTVWIELSTQRPVYARMSTNNHLSEPPQPSDPAHLQFQMLKLPCHPSTPRNPTSSSSAPAIPIYLVHSILL
jgi:hypothetical protein